MYKLKLMCDWVYSSWTLKCNSSFIFDRMIDGFRHLTTPGPLRHSRLKREHKTAWGNACVPPAVTPGSPPWSIPQDDLYLFCCHSNGWITAKHLPSQRHKTHQNEWDKGPLEIQQQENIKYNIKNTRKEEQKWNKWLELVRESAPFFGSPCLSSLSLEELMEVSPAFPGNAFRKDLETVMCSFAIRFMSNASKHVDVAAYDADLWACAHMLLLQGWTHVPIPSPRRFYNGLFLTRVLAAENTWVGDS